MMACAACAGFLPTFGPAYVNFYGGPRTFKLVYDDYYKRLDQGIGEGLRGPMERVLLRTAGPYATATARLLLLGFEFRGRLLLEINTSPLPPTKQLPRNEAIEPTDIVRSCASRATRGPLATALTRARSRDDVHTGANQGDAEPGQVRPARRLPGRQLFQPRGL